MFDSERPEAYEAVYQGLVDRLAAADLATNAAALGLNLEAAGAAQVTLLVREYRVGPDGVGAADDRTVSVSHRIVLAHYLLHGGRGEPAGEFIPYRELSGGQDFARNLALTVEGRLAAGFTGRADALAAAAEALGGRPADPGASCDAAYDFPALPGLPLRFTFYDADEDFPAEAKIFYDAAALTFLDLECLAVLGLLLVQELEAVDERRRDDRDRPG